MTDWTSWDDCPACPARAGQPCRNLRCANQRPITRAHRRRRRALQWIMAPGVAAGMVRLIPDCVHCANLMFSPLFSEAVYSTCISNGQNPARAAKAAITHHHRTGHPHSRRGGRSTFDLNDTEEL